MRSNSPDLQEHHRVAINAGFPEAHQYTGHLTRACACTLYIGRENNLVVAFALPNIMTP